MVVDRLPPRKQTRVKRLLLLTDNFPVAQRLQRRIEIDYVLFIITGMRINGENPVIIISNY